MKELRYFAAAIAMGVVAVTGSVYQIEKLEHASSNVGIDQLALAAPDVLVPENAIATVAAFDSNQGRNRAGVGTTRRVSTAQRHQNFVTSVSRRDVRGAL